jgi:predicted transcriptional regulator
MPKRGLVLGDLEASVLARLWDGGPADAKTVHAAIGTGRRISLNTVQSAMERLFRKDLLARDKVSHAYVYRPRLTRTQVGARLLGQLADQLSGRSQDGLLFAFSDLTEHADERTIAELERMVARRREELARKPRA